MSSDGLTGGCACGTVRFALDRPPLGAVFCHCSRCQHRTGSAFAVTGLLAPGAYRLVDGSDAVATWDPGDGGWTKAFCRVCGGHVHTSSPDGETVAVRLGAIDGDPGVRPAAHQFTAYAASWLPLPDDGLPRFDERLPASARPSSSPSAATSAT